MEQLVQEGKITYVSSSNYAGWGIATTQLTGESRHFLGCRANCGHCCGIGRSKSTMSTRRPSASW